MFDWVNDLLAFLSDRFSAVLASLNPINLIISIASAVAALLPAPNPDLQVVVDGAVAAIDGVVDWISLFDYFINLPVFLVVLGICLAIETALTVPRVWRFIRSFVT